MDRAEWRLVFLWGVLVAITLVSWQSVRGVFTLYDARLQAAFVVLLAFVKVRIVILDFMQVRNAPIALRLPLEAWVAIVCAALVFMTFDGISSHVVNPAMRGGKTTIKTVRNDAGLPAALVSRSGDRAAAPRCWPDRFTTSALVRTSPALL